jgi:DNA-binding transcriptional LysR family regulator
MPRQKLRRYFRHGMLPQLIVFEAVARLGSVTRAAEELHLAQPTVSTQLRKLADTLEVRLLTTQGRGVRLTDAGSAVLEQTCDILHAVHRLEARLDALRLPANNAASQEEDASPWTFPAPSTRPPT